MAITSWDGLVSAWSGGSGSSGTRYGQRCYFHKANIGTPAAYVPQSTWKANGYPITGSLPAFGLSNGRLCKRSDGIGSIPFQPAPSGKTNWLIAVSSGNNSAVTNVIFFDRICDVYTSASGSGAVTGMDATSRLDTGEGGQIWIEVVNAISAATNTLTITYTNQDGISKVTPQFTILASSTANRGAVSSRIYVPLAAGDRGVRTITNINLISGTATGDIAVCIVRPLATVNSLSVALVNDTDLILQVPQACKIYDESCIMFIWWNSTAAVNTVFHGELKLIAQ